jgi:hypothetical protein
VVDTAVSEDVEEAVVWPSGRDGLQAVKADNVSRQRVLVFIASGTSKDKPGEGSRKEEATKVVARAHFPGLCR